MSVCPCKRVVCVDVQACLTLVLSAKTSFESMTKEVGRMLSTSQEVVFRVPSSLSCEIVRVNFASCVGVWVQEPSPAAAAPPAPRWGPHRCPVYFLLFSKLIFIMFSIFNFSLPHCFIFISTGPFFHFCCPFLNVLVIFYMFFSFFRGHALSSRSLGLGLHSPDLLISHLRGLTGTSSVLGFPCYSLATPTVFFFATSS